MINAFSWIFLAALASATAARVWLGERQVRHVCARREAVPGTFAAAIPLAAHRKAADYTVAKARLGMLDVLVGAALTLVLTLGGLIQWISDLWSAWLEPGSILHGSPLPLLAFFLQPPPASPAPLYRLF